MFQNQIGNITLSHDDKLPSPSRRRLIKGALAGGLAAAAVGATGTARAAPGADAALIRLCNRFISVEAKINSFFEGGANEIEDDRERNRVQDPFYAESQKLMNAIINCRATTFAGLAARAKAIAAHYSDWLDPEFFGDPEEMMGAALIRDVLAMKARS